MAHNPLSTITSARLLYPHPASINVAKHLSGTDPATSPTPTPGGLTSARDLYQSAIFDWGEEGFGLAEEIGMNGTSTALKAELTSQYLTLRTSLTTLYLALASLLSSRPVLS